MRKLLKMLPRIDLKKTTKKDLIYAVYIIFMTALLVLFAIYAHVFGQMVMAVVELMTGIGKTR